MREIELTQGYVALVDDEDYAELAQHKWHALVDQHTVYAGCHLSRDDGRRVMLRMHRMMTGAQGNTEVDHRDGDGLNNQRGNLRLCTKTENQQNRQKLCTAASRYKGVSRHHGKWRARLQVNHRRTVLGNFDDESDAARAYDVAARETFGEFACTNFPQGDERPATNRRG